MGHVGETKNKAILFTIISQTFYNKKPFRGGGTSDSRLKMSGMTDSGRIPPGLVKRIE